jgi:hypothetical protein
MKTTRKSDSQIMQILLLKKVLSRLIILETVITKFNTHTY